jgi:glycosyltransferase involved in cell wall biosynthesis
VSFVIPVLESLDDAVRLKTCLESITRSDYPPELIEIIVVHNGSCGDSAHVARRHGAIVIKSRGPVAELRDRGARAALGGVLVFLDPDHEIDCQWIRSVVHALAAGGVPAAGLPYLAIPRTLFDDLGGFDAALPVTTTHAPC